MGMKHVQKVSSEAGIPESIWPTGKCQERSLGRWVGKGAGTTPRNPDLSFMQPAGSHQRF